MRRNEIGKHLHDLVKIIFQQIHLFLMEYVVQLNRASMQSKIELEDIVRELSQKYLLNK